MVRHLLVVGGNGFLGEFSVRPRVVFIPSITPGSAVCKSALANSWSVSSVSPSGRPFASPAGHRPAWSYDVHWHSGSALDPDTYKHLLPPITDIVVSVGTLFENPNYKRLASASSGAGALAALNAALTSRNPLVNSNQSYQ